MKNLLNLWLLALLLPCGAPAQILDTWWFVERTAVPDDSLGGLTYSETLDSPVTFITDLDVFLMVEGGFNGDLYVTLSHDSGFSVLLNRIGVGPGQPGGSTDPGFGMGFTLDDSGPDVHGAASGGGPLGGRWGPDGRDVSPLLVTGLEPRTALLGSFNGLDANGIWTLHIADVSPSGQGTLVKWGMAIRGVPEPGPFITLAPVAAIAARLLLRRCRRK